MSARSAGGGSIGDHYAALARKGRRAMPVAPQIPDEAAHVWNAFTKLHDARGSSGFGPVPIGWSEIEAFTRLMGTRLDPWEVEAIRVLDDAFLEAVAEAGKRGKP